MEFSIDQIILVLGAALTDLVRFLSRLVPMFMAGLFLAGIMRLSPLAGRISILMRPLARLAGLPKSCSLVFVLTVMNRAAGLAALSDLYEKGRLTQNQVIATCLCAYFPAALHHIIFWAAPVSLPMLGMRTSAVFLGSLLAIGSIRTLTGVTVARFIHRRQEAGQLAPPADPVMERLTWPQIIRRSLKEALRQLLRILKVFAPTLFVALLLIKSGLMNVLAMAANPLSNAVGLPPTALVLIVAAAPSTIAGISTAGALVAAGDLTQGQAVLSLIVAHFFNRLYMMARTWFPLNLAIFGAKLGGRIGVASLITEFTWLPWFAVFLLLYRYL